MSSEIIHIRVGEDLKEALQRYAEEDARTLSGLVHRILRDWVAAAELQRERETRRAGRGR
jgi:hypothetical protein